MRNLRLPALFLALTLILRAAPAAPPAPDGRAVIGPSFASGRGLNGQALQAPLVLEYIANAGVLVSSGDLKVLIDAVFDKPNPEYRAPAAGVLEKILAGQAPFDGLDAVLVTHNHPDHFDPTLAARFLERLAGPLLLAPADAVEAMRRVAA